VNDNSSRRGGVQLCEEAVLKEKMEGIGRLARRISHDLNNIVTIIKGNADLLQMIASKESHLAKYISAIIAACNRASSLSSQLSLLNEKKGFQPMPVDLNRLLEGMELKIRELLAIGVELELDLEPSLWKFMGDQRTIEDIVVNLVNNACDAMGDGGLLRITSSNLELAIDPSDSDINFHRKGKWVVFSVRDNGKGIDKSIMNRIFEPFFTTKEKGEADGLGLSRVYGLVKAAEGFIRVESEPKKGTAFIIYFPAL